ncbi:dsDNA nuclease domain-containing protein [Leptospira licerasiae]|uniref:PF14130 domain protein n=1 Tax=Leptospira licerasiae str. MMD4847 TaxID=1049971 RepID=A0ABN0HDN4_9LEPT|nr:dsDNA nuclease domain-containing protein [Leptospira licerasiae]EJZ43853.1 PF14130 domain protein [Leptospira licerasiae str. MMD4847]
MQNILNSNPPDDSGADSFSRFIYQADIAFPYCIRCIIDENIVSVTMEHYEDIVIQESGDRWRFIQVKTRNPELGPWKLSDVLGESGAIHSLYRTYKEIQNFNFSLEMILEGAIKKDDDLNSFKNGSYNKLIEKKVQDKLEIDESEVKKFLSKVTLLPSPSSRDDIKVRNRDLVHSQNPRLQRDSILRIENILLTELSKAMSLDRLKEGWPKYIINPDSEIEEKIKAKTLSRITLCQLIPELQVSQSLSYLLTQITSADKSPSVVSTLERKLRRGGGTEEIISTARMLRANTQKFLIEKRIIQGAINESILDDLDIRIETQAKSRLSLYVNGDNPAIHLWNKLLEDFTSISDKIDMNQLLNADPMLLLGEACQRAEECKISFGGGYED